METRKIVRYSFIFVIVLLMIVFITNSIVTSKMRDNLLLKQKISEVILIQDEMNSILEDIIFVKNKKELENIRIKFQQIEKTFENKLSIINKESFSLISDKQSLVIKKTIIKY